MGLGTDREVRIPLPVGPLLGDLTLPEGASALVLFVNGRGCGRHGLEDRALARAVQAVGLGTLLMDLLTPAQQQERPHPGLHGVDLPLLTQRVLDVTAWLSHEPDLREMGLGLCGICGGAAAALLAGARLGGGLNALVTLGGRADLASLAALASIRAGTLLLAGTEDAQALKSNDAAYQHLRCERSEAVIPGAGAALDDPAVLAHAAEMTANWLGTHLAALEEMA